MASKRPASRKARASGYQAKFDKADRGNPWLNDPGDETPLTEAEEFELLRDNGTKPEHLGDKAKAERYRKWLRKNPGLEEEGPLSANEKYARVFGGITSLAHTIPWSMGVSNMLEWLTWSTNDLLGVTKTKYTEKVVRWSHEKAGRPSFDELLRHVKNEIRLEMRRTEGGDRDSPRVSGIVSPREALRRAKFYSEDYLNKEFDIFMTLVSDGYLDAFYGRHTRIAGGGNWYTHGNSGIFATSTRIREMQMDNLCYNPDEGLLVANELKLRGRKNPDQILKYAYMYRQLRARGFIGKDTRLLLLFIGDDEEKWSWEQLIEEEIRYCLKSRKSTARMALEEQNVEIARGASFDSTTWNEIVKFNEKFMADLDLPAQQVERRLVWGFNEALRSKLILLRGN